MPLKLTKNSFYGAMTNIKIENIRREFGATPMQFDQLPENPHSLFASWFAQVIDANIEDPTACVLATVDEHHMPDTRVVLLKSYADDHFIFYTNYTSRKAQHILTNPWVALNFYWPSLVRQIRIRGKANKIDAQQSEQYFHSRPRESQIAAYASRQSEVTTREALEKRFSESTQRFIHDAIIPYPSFWGGYCVTPIAYEFWQGRDHRLHDRVQYISENTGWKKHILSP